MCGIALMPKKDIQSILETQKDRGLDSLGILDYQTKILTTSKKDFMGDYYDIIEDTIDIESLDLCFMHHRKASIGGITLDNSHPFKGKKFILAQNGTSPDFMKEYGPIYKKETDSETLLSFLEDTCDTLEECIVALDNIDDVLGIIFVIHKDKTLIYSDSCRGSYVEIADYEDDSTKEITSYVESITNYKPGSFKGEYRNGFSIIIESTTGMILHEWSYDDKYNNTFWTSYIAHGNKKDKKTIKTKKNLTYLQAYSKPKKKQTTQTTMNTYRDNKKKMIDCGLVPMKTLQETASSFVLNDFTSSGDVYAMMDLYGINRTLNEQSKVILSELIYELIKDETGYEYIYNIAKYEVFEEQDGFIDYLFMVPLEYLLGKQILTTDIRVTNLYPIRHFKILRTLDIDYIPEYLLGLSYYFDSLNQLEGYNLFKYIELKDIYNINSYLKLNFGLDKKDLKYNTNNVPILEGDTRREFIGYIYASYTLGISHDKLGVDKDFYDSIINNVKYKDEK